jgi:hypothetical protein
MRSRPVATALVALVAVPVGLAATAAVRRLIGRRTATPAPVPAAAPVAVGVEAARDAVREAVVLPFTRPAAPAPVRPSAPARCGESGGRTKAGAPCAARATVAGRCHHHRIAA